MIESYNNFDLQDTKAARSSAAIDKQSKSIDEDSLDTKEDDSNSHFQSKDSTEDHGSFTGNDDDYLQKTVPNKFVTVPVLVTASRENEDDDGCIHSEFTGHDCAVSEVYEEYKESAFVEDEASYDQEYNDWTYDHTALY